MFDAIVMALVLDAATEGRPEKRVRVEANHGGDLAESAVVSGSRVAVVAELAALDVGRVAQEHDTRR